MQLRIVFRAVVLVATLTACGAGETTANSYSVVGTWTLNTSALRFTADGLLEVTATTGVAGLDTPDVTATYTVNDSEISMVDTGGPFACPGNQTGVYTVSVSSTCLTFAVQTDDCTARVTPLESGSWTRN